MQNLPLYGRGGKELQFYFYTLNYAWRATKKNTEKSKEKGL